MLSKCIRLDVEWLYLFSERVEWLYLFQKVNCCFLKRKKMYFLFIYFSLYANLQCFLLTAGNIQVKCDKSHFSNCWQLYDFTVMTSTLRHSDIVSKKASKLWDSIKLIKRSLWILSPKAARSSQTGSPLTFNLMRNIFTVTFWKRVSDPIQHSGVRHWAIYLSVLPIWTWRAKCVHATPTFYLVSKFRLLLVFYFHLCFCPSKFLIRNKYQMEMERICMVVPCSHDTC